MGRTQIKSLPDLAEARLRNKKPEIIYDNIMPSAYILNALSNKKYFIRTYGCQANVRDSETLSGLLSNLNMVETTEVEEADVILINTCAVRENAEDKVFGEIGNLKKIKEKNKDLIIAVCGCMVEQSHIVNQMIETYNQIDLIFGTHDIFNFYSLLEEVIETRHRIISVHSVVGDVHEITCSKRSDKHRAFVNIMYGCNKFCTYCIVPYTRGIERSRKKEDILAEMNELISEGYIEITLLGQNVNSYGKDLYEDYNFANLLEDAAKTGIERLRFTTSHPWDFDENMFDVIAKYDNIMKYIHLPVQSGNSEILRLMNRRYDREKYLNLIKKLRDRIPDVAISTDIIVGFPNETYDQFLDTLSLVKEVKYDFGFTFIYSPRQGTPAAKMIDNVTYEEKIKRFKMLTDELNEIVDTKAKLMVGKTYKVLVDDVSKKNDEFLSGYTEQGKLVNFKGGADVIGKVVKIKITESHGYHLIGEIDE
ncbi:MAG: tRNA (N6-isopentenyl adenosine(37)-C2)-methylthiotransferase MiaB [Bacilli bacterium]